MKKLSVFLIAILMVLFAFGTANAVAFLDGKQIFATYEQPLTTLQQTYGLLTVGPGVEIPNDLFPGGPYFSVDISDTKITFNFLQNGYFQPQPSTYFDGLHFQDTTNTITGFASLAINPATTLTGFDASRISWNGNNIWLDFQGLNFSTGMIASVDVTPTPIPGAVWLLGSGIIGLIGLKRRGIRS